MSIATTAALLETSGWAAMLLHQLCICLSAWDGCCGELPGDISDRHCLKISLCALSASTWQSCLHKEATKVPELPLHALYIVQHKQTGRAWQEGTSADGVYTVRSPGRRL